MSRQRLNGVIASVVALGILAALPAVAETAKSPRQTGEGAGVGAVVEVIGSPAPSELPIPFVASDARLTGWFDATSGVLRGLEADLVEAQFDWQERRLELDAAVTGVETANLEATKFAIRYGINSDIAMLELAVMLDMGVGTLDPTAAVRGLQDLRNMRGHADAVINAAQRRLSAAVAALETARARVDDITGELENLRRFASHLVTVDDLIAGTEMPTESIDALLFSVSAPVPVYTAADGRWPWERNLGDASAVSESNAQPTDHSASSPTRPVVNGQTPLSEQSPLAGQFDFVMRVAADELDAVKSNLIGRTYAVFPTRSVRIDGVNVQAIGLDDTNVSAAGLSSVPQGNFVIGAQSARIAAGLRIGSQSVITTAPMRRFDRAGAAIPGERSKDVLTSTTGTPSFTVAGFAPLIPGAGAAIPSSLLTAGTSAVQYLVAVDLAAASDSVRFTWTTMMQHPAGSVLRTTAAPDPTEFYTPAEADAVLGVMRYYDAGSIDGRQVDVVGQYTEDHIRVRNYPVLGSFACNEAVAAQLAGALAETVLRGLGEAVDPALFGGCYNARLIREGGGLSYHAWGLAVDLNVRDNLMYTVGKMNPGVIEVFKAWGFRWGGDWSTTDPMHFETAAVLRPSR